MLTVRHDPVAAQDRGYAAIARDGEQVAGPLRRGGKVRCFFVELGLDGNQAHDGPALAETKGAEPGRRQLAGPCSRPARPGTHHLPDRCQGPIVLRPSHVGLHGVEQRTGHLLDGGQVLLANGADLADDDATGRERSGVDHHGVHLVETAQHTRVHGHHLACG